MTFSGSIEKTTNIIKIKISLSNPTYTYWSNSIGKLGISVKRAGKSLCKFGI